MEVEDLDSAYNVWVSERDIADFNSTWPVSGIRGLRGVTFQFDKNGDLRNIWYDNGSADDWDSPALAALSQNAQAYGEKELVDPQRDPQALAKAAARAYVAAHPSPGNVLWPGDPGYGKNPRPFTNPTYTPAEISRRLSEHPDIKSGFTRSGDDDAAIADAFGFGDDWTQAHKGWKMLTEGKIPGWKAEFAHGYHWLNKSGRAPNPGPTNAELVGKLKF